MALTGQLVRFVFDDPSRGLENKARTRTHNFIEASTSEFASMQRASTLQAALRSVDKTKRTANLRWRTVDESKVSVTTLREIPRIGLHFGVPRLKSFGNLRPEKAAPSSVPARGPRCWMYGAPVDEMGE